MYSPVPTTNPKPATAHRIEASVIPLTLPPCAIIAPAPRNPMPVTIASDILDVVGSSESLIVVNVVAQGY
jgi:hypothetical protein